MDLRSIIRVLNEEKARLDEVIQNLETLGAAKGVRDVSKRRGRKTMPEAERKAVAERMRKYWEAKRKK